MKEQKDSSVQTEEDIKLILSAFNEMKDKLTSISFLPEQALEKVCKAAEEIDSLIRESVSAYDLENKEPEESSQKAELKDGDPVDGTEEGDIPEKKGDFEVAMTSPRSGETIDDFMTRCMYDTNSRTLYSNEQDRFKACMLKGNGFNFRPDKATPPYVDQ